MDFHIFKILKVKQKPRLSKMCIICGFLCVLYLLTNTIVVFELAHYDRSGSSASDAIVNQSFIIKTVEEYVAGYVSFIAKTFYLFISKIINNISCVRLYWFS